MSMTMKIFCCVANGVLICVYVVSRESYVLSLILFEETISRASFTKSPHIQKQKRLTLLVSSVSRHCFIMVYLSYHFLILIVRIISNIDLLPRIQKGKMFKTLRSRRSYLTFPVIIKPILWYFVKFFRLFKVVHNFLVNKFFLLLAVFDVL